MKLFQRLLVAPAALGLLTPLSANATEVNLNEISNYSDVESIEVVISFDDESSNLLYGDSNQDGSVNILDVVMIVNFITGDLDFTSVTFPTEPS